MKKLYSIFFALVFSVASYSQFSTDLELLNNSKKINYSEFSQQTPVLNPQNSSSLINSNLIWESDFSDPSDWVLDNSGQNPPNYGWSIDAISHGWWSNNGITSTSGGNFAELSNGDPTLTPGTQAAAVVYTMTTAQPINIYDSIGSSNATLSFEEYGARFYDLQEVQISLDGINFVTVADNQAYSQLTASGGSPYPNPSLREINLVNYLGNNPTSVWVRFSWTSALNLPVTDQYYYNTWISYGWYIDDVKVSESPANRVTMEDEVIGGFWLDYLNYSGAGLNYMVGLDYSVTPLSQLQNHPYAIEALFRNEGTSSQSVKLNYDVTGTSTANGSSNTVVLNPGDSVFLGASYSPSTIGVYSIDIWGEADSAGVGVTNTLTNMESRDIQVTDYIYGKDLGVSNSSTYILGGLEDQNHITTRFEMYADEQLYGLRAYIGKPTDVQINEIVGAEVKAIIYELDTTIPSSAGGAVFIAESDNYTITAQDINSWVDIPFVDPVPLRSGFAYEFGIVGFQHPTLKSYIGTSGNSLYNGEHSLFDEMGLSSSSNGTPTWYYITTTPMVRMNFDPSLIASTSNVNSMDFVSLFPNPSNGVFTISLKNQAEYNLSVTNMIGQEVAKTYLTNSINQIDLTNLPKGIYNLSIFNRLEKFDEKIIIE